MTDFKIPKAEFKGIKYTPEEWQQKNTLSSKSKKKTDANLLCPDGCTLLFRKGSKYINKHGTQVIVRPHFAHLNQSKTDSCLYVKKYGSNGESKEHFETKESIAANGIVAHEVCSYPNCSSVKEYRSHEDWLAKTEVKLNNKWFMDVVFYDTNGEIALVVEVKHTHGTDGVKREWLLQQNFDYIEVDTNGPTYTVLDSKTDYWCMNNHKCKTEKEEIMQEMKRYFYQWFKSVDVTLGLYELIHSWDGEYVNFCTVETDNKFENYYGHHENIYRIKLWDIEKFNNLLESHLLPSGTSYNEYRQSKIDEKNRKTKEEWKEKEKNLRKEINKKERDFRNAWKNSNINKQLLKWQPQFKYPSGKLKGCHLLIVMFAHSHSINWLLGHSEQNIIWKSYVQKNQRIYEKSYNALKGRKLLDVQREYDQTYDSSSYYEVMQEWINDNNSYENQKVIRKHLF